MVNASDSIARYLQRAVEQKIVLQKDLAEAAGVTEQAASKWVKSGKIALESLIAVASKLNVSLDEIVGLRPPSEIKEAASCYVFRMNDIQQLTPYRRAILWRILDVLLAEQNSHLKPTASFQQRIEPTMQEGPKITELDPEDIHRAYLDALAAIVTAVGWQIDPIRLYADLQALANLHARQGRGLSAGLIDELVRTVENRLLQKHGDH